MWITLPEAVGMYARAWQARYGTAAIRMVREKAQDLKQRATCKATRFGARSLASWSTPLSSQGPKTAKRSRYGTPSGELAKQPAHAGDGARRIPVEIMPHQRLCGESYLREQGLGGGRGSVIQHSPHLGRTILLRSQLNGQSRPSCRARVRSDVLEDRGAAGAYCDRDRPRRARPARSRRRRAAASR
jgi:hypothetical protein